MLKTSAIRYVDFQSQKLLSTSFSDQINYVSKSLGGDLDGRAIAKVQPSINLILSEIDNKNLSEFQLKKIHSKSSTEIISNFFR
jgi:hypothetical protein